jgi:hypothetical protein
MTNDLNGPLWQIIREQMSQDLRQYGSAIPTKEEKMVTQECTSRQQAEDFASLLRSQGHFAEVHWSLYHNGWVVNANR